MSNFPPFDYGQPYGNPNHAPYLQGPYPHSYYNYGNDHTGQAPLGMGYDMSMSAYAYNNSMLGFASVAPPGTSNQPNYQAWNQTDFHQYSFPSSQGPPPPGTYSAFRQHNVQQHDSHYTEYGIRSQQGHQQLSPAVGNSIRDLSEGEFVDAPVSGPSRVESSTSIKNTQSINGIGYADTAFRAVCAKGNEYSRAQGLVSALGPRDNQAANGRNPRSTSNSPYISPIPVTQGEQHTPSEPKAQDVPVNGKATSAHQAEPSTVMDSVPRHFADGQPPLQNDPRPQAGDDLKLAPAILESSHSKSHGSLSVTAARKGAEAAILNLWSYEVRYPNFLEAGMDQPIVEKLFNNLKLSKAYSKPVNNSGSQEAVKPPVNSPSIRATTSSVTSVPLSASSTLHGTSPKSLKHNERTESKPPVISEKERTLQLKMEALRKSREERAQKKAAKNGLKLPEVAVPNLPKDNTKPVKENSPCTPSPLIPPSTSLSNPPSKPVSHQGTNVEQVNPAIPGLFLSSASPSNMNLNTSSSAISDSTSPNPSKRPVGTDMCPPGSAIPSKRPFGHSRNEKPLVIDVSDEVDSDEDMAMDLDSQGDSASPGASVRKPSDQGSGSTNPTLSESIRPPSILSTPLKAMPIIKSTRPSLHSLDHLQAKQQEIEEMKRKIANLEQQRGKSKGSRPNSNGAQTPVTNRIEVPRVDSIMKAVLATQNADAEAHDVASTEFPDQYPLVKESEQGVRLAEQEKQDEAERKRLKREKIAAILPNIDSEIEQKQRRLEELNQEKSQVETTLRRNLVDKQFLMAEMERLGLEADEQLQLQKAKLRDLASQESIEDSCPRELTPPRNVALEASDPSSETAQLQQLKDKLLEMRASDTTEEQLQSKAKANSLEPEGGVEKMVDTATVKDGTVSNQELEAALQDAVRAEVESHDEEMADVEAAEPDRLPTPALSLAEVYEAASDAEEGELSSEYSPALEHNEVEKSENDSDNYEPPEATPPIDEDSNSRFSLSSPAPTTSVNVEIMPEGSQSYDLTKLSHTIGAPMPDDIGPLMAHKLSTVGRVETIVGETFHPTGRFTPYESPLKQFRAYRYHPEYNETVSDGQRSMSYAHKIDPHKELCCFELAGGVCNDNTCELQHFREMGLPDDEILKALGSSPEFSGEVNKRFIASFKELLSKLRTIGIKDFDTIANEITAHRANFLGDKSKILFLDGTTI